ncbi:MAG: ester cyclase [Chloroflexota bacterium]
MSTEANKATVRRWVEGGWNGGNLNLIDEMYTPDFMIHDPSAPNFQGGTEAFKGFIGGFRTALPDIHFTIEDMIATGDIVVWRWTARATSLGPLMGIPPTGKRATVTGIVISRFDENGKWAEDYINWDTLGLLQQIGVVPTPGDEPVRAGR